jgi:hypothetical protein
MIGAIAAAYRQNQLGLLRERSCNIRAMFAHAMTGKTKDLFTGLNWSLTLAPLIAKVALENSPIRYRHTTWPPNVGVKAAPRTNNKKQNVETRYVGFLPTVSESGPAKREPELIPKRYMAVDRLSASLLT